MKKILRFVTAFVLVALTSCRHEPVGIETSINEMGTLYSQGEIKEFTFIDKGTWILGELTDEALSSNKYIDEINYMISKKIISKEADFRFMAKVLSMEEFINEVKEKTGKTPLIRRIK